jgi:hypothetical protein
MENVDGPLNYAALCELNEVLELVMEHCELARNASDELKLFVHLKMASRAMRCALELYGSHIGAPTKEKK